MYFLFLSLFFFTRPFGLPPPTPFVPFLIFLLYKNPPPPPIKNLTDEAGWLRYEQLTLRANSLREELHTEIEKMLNDIIKFKVHIQKNLEDYEGFVADELEKELGSDEIRGDETISRGFEM